MKLITITLVLLLVTTAGFAQRGYHERFNGGAHFSAGGNGGYGHGYGGYAHASYYGGGRGFYRGPGYGYAPAPYYAPQPYYAPAPYYAPPVPYFHRPYFPHPFFHPFYGRRGRW